MELSPLHFVVCTARVTPRPLLHLTSSSVVGILSSLNEAVHIFTGMAVMVKTVKYAPNLTVTVEPGSQGKSVD